MKKLFTILCTVFCFQTNAQIITTIAGSIPGFSGNGQQATMANLSPMGLAIDANGNLFITDSVTVRKIDQSTGIISTITGNGNSGNSPNGTPATSAQLNPIGLNFDK